jgi:hypothetical protein
MRKKNPAPSEILAERMAQIDAAYKARLRTRMTAEARAALERERKRQVRLAQAEFKAAKPTVTVAVGKKSPITSKKKFVRPTVKPRRPGIPIGGIPQYVQAVKPTHPEPPDTPTWQYHDRETGAPVHPWEVMTHDEFGRAYDDEDVDDSDVESRMFPDDDYSYEDFEADWGGYDHQDTGYADENT